MNVMERNGEPLQEKLALLAMKLKCPAHPSKQLRAQCGSKLQSLVWGKCQSTVFCVL